MFRLAPIEFTNENVSGLMGSISIACWVIVFVPQIYENFYRGSAEGLSLLFVVLWLAGDVFNLVGAMMQHLLTTMIILAAYYTVADVILLIQCLWYDRDKGVSIDEVTSEDEIDELNPIHFSPANPINENVLQDVFNEQQPLLVSTSRHQSVDNTYSSTGEQIEEEIVMEQSLDKGNYTSDLVIVSCVIFAGFISWYIPYCNKYYKGKDLTILTKFTTLSRHKQDPDIEVNWLAQFFGYLSALLYLGSRIPQILLNFQRKSCEGISFLFFLFACLGNTTFITSVVAISLDPKYLLVNASWLIGSSGTLIMDFIIFGQFFLYGRGPADESKTTSPQLEA